MVFIIGCRMRNYSLAVNFLRYLSKHLPKIRSYSSLCRSGKTVLLLLVLHTADKHARFTFICLDSYSLKNIIVAM